MHHSSCVYTPQQNGVAERKNEHLLEVARSIMFTMNVPKLFWREAILTAAYLINRMPSPTLKVSNTYPYAPTDIRRHQTHLFPTNKSIWLHYICSHTPTSKQTRSKSSQMHLSWLLLYKKRL